MPSATYLVLIHLNRGKREVLRAYERGAREVMARHGGAFERVFIPQDPGLGIGAPDEVHLLRFDSEAGFAAFRSDPALAHLAGLREEAVKSATVLPVAEVALDRYFGAEPLD